MSEQQAFYLVIGQTYRITHRPGGVVIGYLDDITVHKPSGDRHFRLITRGGKEVAVWESMVIAVEPSEAFPMSDPFDDDDRTPCACPSLQHSYAGDDERGPCRRVTRHPTGLCGDCRDMVAPPPPPAHLTTVEDVTRTLGYGEAGHGTWRVSCICGWVGWTSHGGRNRALSLAADHRRS